MPAESTHAFAPLVVSGIVLIVSYFSEEFALKRIAHYLERNYREQAELRETILKLAEGVLTLTGFLVNGMLLIANCFIAFIIYPIQSRAVLLTLVIVDFVVLVLLVIQIIWVLATMDIMDIAEYTINKGRWSLRALLRWEQAAFVIVALVLFSVGFALGQPSPDDPASPAATHAH